MRERARRSRHDGTILLLTLIAIVVAAGPAIAQNVTPEQAAAIEFNAALGLQNKGLHDRAAQKWAAFVAKHPNYKRLDSAYFCLGTCQLRAKKHQEAVKSFQTVLAKYPNFQFAAGAQFSLGTAYFQIAAASKKVDDFKSAAAAFAAVASKYGDSKYAPKALYQQGESLYAIGDLKGAAAAHAKLIADHKTSSLLPDAYYVLGTTQQELKLPAEAEKTFRAFLANASLANHELADEVRLWLGMALFDQKKYEEAEKLFGQVAPVAKFPRADFALFRQAQCRIRLKKQADAVALFEEFFRKFPNSDFKDSAQLAAGKCYFLTGRFNEAQPMLTALAGQTKDESPEAAYWLGRTLLKLKKPADALTLLDKATAAFTEGPFVPYLQMTRVEALYELPDRRKETPALYAAFVAKYPNHDLAAQALYMASLAALGQEDYPSARKHAEAFLANTKFAAGELAAGVIYIAAESHLLGAEKKDGGDMAKAEQLYRQLVTKHPNHQRVARSHLRIGWCLFQAKKQGESATYLTGVLGQLKDPSHVAEAQLLIGHGHDAGGKHQEAVTAYDAALKAKPDWSRTDEVLLAAARSLRKIEQPAAAAARLNQLVTAHKNSSLMDQALYELGEIAQEGKKLDEAVKQYTEVVEKYPESKFVPDAYYGLGACHFNQEDYFGALGALSKLLAGKGDEKLIARGRYLRGLVYQRQKKFDLAAKDMQDYLAAEPTGEIALDARYGLALCQIGLKKFDEASTVLAELLKEKPDYANADKVYYEMGHALAADGKKEASVASFRTLVEKMPDSPLVAESHFRVGRYHESLSDASKDEAAKTQQIAKAADAYAAGAAKAKDADLREKLQYKLGDMRFRQEKFDQAAEALLAQIKEHPNGDYVGAGRFLAAESLFRLERYEEALPLFMAVAADAKVEKYHADALYQAGACAKELKNWPESAKHYQALIDRFPDFDLITDARFGLAVTFKNRGELDQAVALYEQVTKETTGETGARARFEIGEIAFAQKRYEDAIEHFIGVTAYPDEDFYKEWKGLAHFETGRCFIELKQNDKAIASLKIVVDKFSDHPKAKAAQTLIDELQK